MNNKKLVHKLKEETKRCSMDCYKSLIEESFNYDKAKQKLLKHKRPIG